MKKILSLILVLLMLASLAACGNQTETDPILPPETDPSANESESADAPESETQAPETEEDTRPDLTDVPFVPELRFIVTSDTHITPSTGTGASLLKTAIEQITAYVNDSEKNDGYDKLDAVVVVGDVTNNGTTEEFGVAKKYFNEVIPRGTELLLVMGNHDWNTYAENSRTEFEKALGDAATHLVIGGYHFITVVNDIKHPTAAWRGYGWDYSEASLKQTQKALESANRDTGKDKPIFVFQHIGVYNTVAGTGPDAASSNTAVETMTEMYSSFPNTVVFTGHSHFPINDECSIHQKDFTALNTGALSAGMKPRLNGTQLEMASRSDAKSVYLLEVDAYGRLRIRIWRTVNNGFIGDEWFIDSYRKNEFTYTEDRFEADDLFFAENAKIAVYDVFDTAASISFPVVPKESLSARVYEVVLTDAAGKVISTEYLTLEYYTENFDTKLQLKLDGLTANTPYTVSVCAVNPLYSVDVADEGTLRSAPLTATFTTSAGGSGDGADIIDVRLYADADVVGSASVTNLMPQIIGNPLVFHDPSIGMDAVSVDGIAGDLVKFSYNEFSDKLTDGFTFETYICVDEKPAENAVLIGAMHGGAFGLVAQPNGTLRFDIHNGSTYLKLSSTYTVGTYHHVVVTFDGSHTRLYVDGKEVGSVAMTTFNLPTNTSYRQLYLGADSYIQSKWETGGKCSIAVFRLYSDVLSTEDVVNNYNELTK